MRDSRKEQRRRKTSCRHDTFSGILIDYVESMCVVRSIETRQNLTVREATRPHQQVSTFLAVVLERVIYLITSKVQTLRRRQTRCTCSVPFRKRTRAGGRSGDPVSSPPASSARGPSRESVSCLAKDTLPDLMRIITHTLFPSSSWIYYHQ